MAVGFGIAPFVLGAFADRVGAHAAFLLVPLFLAGAGALVVPLRRRLAVRPVPATEVVTAAVPG